MAAAVPSDEAERLAALQRYRILDTPEERAFDRVAELVKRALAVPIVVVSLVDERRQWFKACVGLGDRETAREVSFCAHAILGDEPMVVADATRDTRFATNPLVVRDPSIRAYAGAPLRTPSGLKLGALAAIDTRPRMFTSDQLALLEGLASVIVDELELRLARHELEERNQQLRGILDAAQEGITIADAKGDLVYYNQAAHDIIGYLATERVMGQWPDDHVVLHPDRKTPFERSQLPLTRALRGETVPPVEMFVRNARIPAGKYVRTSARPLPSGAVVTFSDVTDLVAANQQLAELATTDALTGVANRRAFDQRLDTLVAEGERGRGFALVVADVDHFKRFNDTFGHQVGDQVLAGVAKRLAARVRRIDLAARYGGEEFAVLLVDVDLPRAVAIAEELRVSLASADGPHRVTASFGVASFQRGMTADAIVAAADEAVYAAKHGGRNRVATAAA
jgi:diguanylate cyclase (GGDEF)-like protein/PAS domain S-box-containing protein|nr:sensor domain-containing diguanylate cyclase [Kofleriaceae bacterium]